MNTWIFQGNPKRFDIDDYLARYPELIYWYTPKYSSEISIGDIAYIWRAGENSGAVAVGKVVELPTPAHMVAKPSALGDDLWRSEPPSPDELKTGISLDEIRLTHEENMVPRSHIKDHGLFAYSQLIKMGSGSIFKLGMEQGQELARIWGWQPIGATPGSSYKEGTKRLVSHYRRERSSRLRKDKLEQFKSTYGSLHCELCGKTGESEFTPELSERIFEIHHTAPLSLAAKLVKTTLDDLAVVCANCHRMVHASEDVVVNFQKLRKHYAVNS